jgi:2-dehydropantoate 2-reductase
MMSICIYGAGAIGGFLGVQLALAGEEVTLIARGPHLEAMKKNGVKLHIAGEERIAHPRCTDNPNEVGSQDYLIITLKTHSMPGIVDTIQPLLSPRTTVVMGVNGIPFWYFYRLEGPWQDYQIESVDPGGEQWEKICPERVIGCVIHPAAEVSAPGVIRHIDGNRFSLGEPNGEKTERITQLSEILRKAGLKAPIRSHIRNEIWVNLWGNLCFNPISALTHATLDVIATNPGPQAVARAMMLEAQAVGEKLGVRFGIDIERQIAGAAAVGAHKTSMLQDLERGKPMEIDGVLTVVQEIGHLVEVETPTIDVVLSLVQQRARIAGCY